MKPDYLVVTIGKGRATHLKWYGEDYMWCGISGKAYPQSKNPAHVTCKNCLREMRREWLK